MNNLGLKRGTVRLVGHNPKWKDLFASEKDLLLKKLPIQIIEVSHGGSTAIPGIPAKPIIDMFALVHSLNGVEEMKEELAGIGYEYLGEEGVPERRLAVKGPPELRTHHLQFVEEKSQEWSNHILLREYYLRHRDVAQEYANLKIDLARKFPQDRQAYTSSKDAFIKLIIQKAEAEGK